MNIVADRMQFRIVAALFLLGTAVHAQTVSGVIINAITQEAIPDATVTFSAGPRTYRESADQGGAFRVLNVEPGEYSVRVVKEGFDATPSPARLDVLSTAEPPIVRLSVTPWPSLRGRVLDPERNPAVQIPVQLISLNGEPRESAVTNDDGRFHFDAVPPGRYALLARPLTAAESVEDSQLAPTYFPNVSELSDASPVVVISGEHHSGFEIVLRSLPVFRVAGRVVDEHGDPASGTVLQISNADTHFSNVSADEDGAFEFSKVRRGSGRISAELRRGETLLRGTTSIHVTANSLEHVMLRLVPPGALAVTVELDSQPISFRGDAVLVPADGRAKWFKGSIDDDQIRFRDVYPGRYRLVVAPTIGAAYVDAVVSGELDIALDEFEVTEGSAPLRVVLKSGGGTVRGTVEGRTVRTVLLVPHEERLRGIPFVMYTPCAGGRFEFEHVRPGIYHVLLEDPSDAPGFQDPVALRIRVEAAPTVRVEKSSVATIILH